MVKHPTDKLLQGYFDDLLNDDGENLWAGKKPSVVSKTNSVKTLPKSKSNANVESVAPDVKMSDVKAKAKSTVSPLVQTRISQKVENEQDKNNNKKPLRIKPVTNKNVSTKSTNEHITHERNTREEGSSVRDDSPAKYTSHDVVQNQKDVEPSVLPRPAAQPQQKVEDDRTEHALFEMARREKLQQLLDQQTVTDLMPTEVDVEKTDVIVETEVEEKVVEQEVALAPAPIQEDTDTALTTQEAEIHEADNTLMQWAANGRPTWAQDTFDVLLFEVSGLSLAVPLVALGQIVPMDDKLTVLSGQSEWFMGILPSHIGDIRTVNTSLFVMPERHNDDFESKVKYVVTIDGLPWGLAVDSVNQPITLKPEDVNWRSQRGKRPWLAGTVKSHMCALIDIPQMAHLLEQCDKNKTE